MELKKYLVPPVAIYAVIFLFISALIGAKINQEANWVWLVSLVILLVGLYFSTNYIKVKNWKEGLVFGISWVVILFLLDLVLTVPFTGWEHFSNWKSYLSYVLTFLAPIIIRKK